MASIKRTATAAALPVLRRSPVRLAVAGVAATAVAVPLIVAHASSSTSSASTPLPVVRLVAGDRPVTDSLGNVWGADAGVAVGGQTRTWATAITGTSDPELYRSERWGLTGYNLPVPAPGTYRVVLHEAEFYWHDPGKRTFDVTAEGHPEISGLDIDKEAGPARALTRSFDVQVTDGVLNLTFHADVDTAKVDSLEVDSLSGIPSSTSPDQPSVLPLPAPVPTAPSASPSAPPSASPSTSPSASSSATASAPSVPADPATWQAPAAGMFGPGSVWKAAIGTAPLNANSTAMVSALAGQVAAVYGGNAAFNVYQYGANIVTVPSLQARSDVHWDDCQHKGYLPGGLTGPGGQFTSVPIPPDAIPSDGTDASLAVYQPSTDTLWDFWKMNHQADGWHACWGGRLDHVSTSEGYFSGGFGTSATGLAGEGGVVQISDVRAGAINHALTLAIPNPASWRDVSWPAQRSDGSPDSTSPIPEGTRFRLDPSVNVDALPLTPIAKMVARAAQRYGFIVSDKAGAVGVAVESGAITQSRTGTNPWGALLAGTPGYNVLHGFPWSSLQALPQDYGKP